MFETAEVGHAIDKETYEAEVPALREALLDAQYDVAQLKKFPVIILIGGVDGAGKGETVNLLNTWMDPRHVSTLAFGTPSDEERERPPMWRFWRALPPKGRVGIFFGSWYTQPILRRVVGGGKNDELDRDCQQIVRFESMLADEGALILKFWFHLSKERQRKRLKSLEKDPKTSWRVTKADWDHFACYDEFARVSERTLRQTGTSKAPWIVVEGEDARYRSLTVGKTILAALRARLDAAAAPAAPAAAPVVPEFPHVDELNVLRALDLTQALERKEYKDRLEEVQGRLNRISRKRKFKERSVVCVFEGNDAAGKGGTIRRLTEALDARSYQIIPVAAPTSEERAQPYLWRFWRHMPRLGRFTIFDRSWYGRVLVERVEGFCSEAEWARAYGEINDFESELAAHGSIVCKFWLAISDEEQLRRFEERQNTGFKRFKITEEDWRNRAKWPAYERAVCDMVERTSTEVAPWTLVPANDKYSARIHVLETICDRIERTL